MNIQRALKDYHDRMRGKSEYIETDIVLSSTTIHTVEVVVTFGIRLFCTTYRVYFDTPTECCDWLYAPSSEQEAISGAQ